MNASVIIYGPQGCGKSMHAEAIAKHLGLSKIDHEFIPGAPLPEDTLALTCLEGIPGARCFYEVMEEMQEPKEEWRIAISRAGFHFCRYIQGRKNESYRVASKEEAAVWAAAIIQGFDPPKKLLKADNPPSQSSCTGHAVSFPEADGSPPPAPTPAAGIANGYITVSEYNARTKRRLVTAMLEDIDSARETYGENSPEYAKQLEFAARPLLDIFPQMIKAYLDQSSSSPR